MSLKKPQPKKDPVAAKCAVCGVECIDMEVNQATLCDVHFDGWLAYPRNPAIGGPAEMAEFIKGAK